MKKGGSRGGANLAPPGFHFATNPDLDPTMDVGPAEVRSAYRMDQPVHLGTSSGCRRNCRQNPACLACLGERGWLEAEEEEESDGELEDELVRQEGLPAGLRNLGNTCYVNSFLQIWFHNPHFRRAMYDWEPAEDPVEAENETILEERYEPRSKVASLQALFAMMQHTKRKFIDPADFICKLGLNPSVQQDAQEFSKLFISLLEDSLAHQATDLVRTMIQKQFRGEYAYVTTCQACGRQSVRPSHFYELDLALAGGNKTIADCLKDFTKIERMTGEEKYFCEGCQCKQEATRSCRLRELPQVLNLQLNRFQYDMTLGRKKKLNSNIQFPEELDMAEYLDSGASGHHTYSLTGVLMHVGPDANHGHYIAHIQELDSGRWFKFSDESVAPLPGKQLLRLGGGGEEDGTGQGRKGSKGKGGAKPGLQNSNNAYMLVYMLQESIAGVRAAETVERLKREEVTRASLAVSCEPVGKRRKLESDHGAEYVYSNCRVFPVHFPQHLRNKIDVDNKEFDEEHEERMSSRMTERLAARTKQARMVEQYRGLRWAGGGPRPEEVGGPRHQAGFEFLPVQWLMRWLANPGLCGPIETRNVLCMHKNLDIDKVVEVKVCDVETVSRLYSQYGEGEGPRLTHDRLCRTCVRNKARTISLDFKMLRDQQFLQSCVSPCDGTGFWVGKKSFQQWRRHAKVALEDQIIRETSGLHASPGKARLRMEQGSPEEEEAFCLTELQAKLQKMGTNVSLAHQDLTGKGGAGLLTGLSVIKNGEAFKMNSVAEMKMNLTEEERKLQWSKPVQAVRPMQKAPKPSATVKPFVKSEGISEMEDPAKPGQAELPAVPSPDAVILVPKTNGVSANGDCIDASVLTNGNAALPAQETSVPVMPVSADALPVITNGVTTNGEKTEPPPSPTVPGTPKPTAKVAPEVELSREEPFNGDILCPHGGLRIEQRVRHLISRAAWHRVSSYFAKPITFQFGTPVCGQCEDELNAAILQKERWKEEAAVQKTRLADLFGDKDRPKWSKKTTLKVFLLSYNFVASWRGFIRGRLTGKTGFDEAITDINNQQLLCEHGGLLHPPTIGWEAQPEPNVVMVSEEEWTAVQEMFTIDVEIRVDRENGPGGPELTASPAPCGLCVASRQEAEQEDRLRYRDSVVFVRRISPDEKLPDADSHADPEYCSSPMLGEAPPPSRRSHRRPKVRGEKEFIVNSDMKLRDFKVKLMETFKVAPYDQNLMVNGEYLKENHSSLGQLKVLPGSLIFLRADEPTHIAPYHSEEVTSQHEEQGFKGTGLLSN